MSAAPGPEARGKPEPLRAHPVGLEVLGHSAAGGVTEVWGGVGGRLGEGQRQRAGGR